MKQVKHPDHYSKGRKYEAWDVAKDWGLDLDLGSVLKYISRMGRKAGESKLKDLYKCMEYIQHEIEYEEELEREKATKRDTAPNCRCTVKDHKPDVEVHNIPDPFKALHEFMDKMAEAEMARVTPIVVKVPDDISVEAFMDFLKTHSNVEELK